MSVKYTCRYCSGSYTGPRCGCCHFDAVWEEHFCSEDCYNKYFHSIINQAITSLRKLSINELENLSKCFEFERTAWELEDHLSLLLGKE